MKNTFLPLIFLILVAGLPDLLHAQTGRAARYEPGDWVNYANFHYVTSFEEGKDYVYIGTTHGVLRFNLNTKQYDFPYTLSSGLQDDYVLNMLWLDEKDELWVFTRGGIDVIYTVLNRWSHIDGTNQIFQQAGRGVRVGTSSGSVWVRVNQAQQFQFDKYGAYYLGPGSPSNQQVQWKSHTDPGTGSANYFLEQQWTFNRLEGTLQNEDFRQFPLTTQYTDRYNQVWIGTWGAGFIRADAVTKEGEVERLGPVSNAVGALFRLDQEFWFGSSGGWMVGPPSIEGEPGISRLARDSGEWEHFTSAEEYEIDNVTVYAIGGDNNRLWFGTDRGLISYRPPDNQWQRFDHPSLERHQVYDVVATDTAVWVASRTGLYQLSHPAGYVRSRVNLLGGQQLNVYAVAVYGESVFAGTDFGLVRVDRTTDGVTYYDDEGKQVSRKKFHGLRTYTLDSAGENLYYANDFGMFELNVSAGTVSQIPKLGLHARSVIRVIEADSTTVWVGFDDGLGRFSSETREWRFFSTEDGLASNQIYDLVVLPGETVWCATRRGVTKFQFNKP